MAERITPVANVRVDFVCEHCWEGNLYATGRVLLTHPPQYPHACPKCHEITVLRTRYPFRRYEPLT